MFVHHNCSPLGAAFMKFSHVAKELSSMMKQMVSTKTSTVFL